ncbi:low molecular weight phosphotyrosine protein phosphatase [Phyllosticta capitalensis]|uniref:Low molecular weight phosphotyrosine protein phosphatase n=1 Tax=Phyllosticta capitalensis TaxID=121624 RepID=A0ABR1YLA7_9PEZI
MATDKKPVSVLFVCLGNICRSTMAEGVFRSLTQNASHPLIAQIDSCGTGAYHVGSRPDSRTLMTLNAHGITDYTHKARKFAYPDDFHDFDYIFAMDKENLEDLEDLRERRAKELKGNEAAVANMGQVMLFGAFAGEGRKSKQGEVVRDPYYGGNDGFEKAYTQVKRFSENFLKHLEGDE